MEYGLTCLVLKLVDKNQLKLSTFFRKIQLYYSFTHPNPP